MYIQTSKYFWNYDWCKVHVALNHTCLLITQSTQRLYCGFMLYLQDGQATSITIFCDPNIPQHSQLPHGCLGLTCFAYHPFAPCWLRRQVQVLSCQGCVCAFLTYKKINSHPNLKWFSLYPTQIHLNSQPYLQFHALARGEFFLLLFFLLHPQSPSPSLRHVGARSSYTTTIQVQAELDYCELG